MKVSSTEFLKSAFQESDWPKDRKPEIAFLGRSNVGKSSLINSLLMVRGLARTSSTPGRTQSLNFFSINDRFRFVDLPGFGYARVPQNIKSTWGDMSLVGQIAELQNYATYKELSWEGSFEEYLGLVRKSPQVTRNAYQRLYDMLVDSVDETG